MTAHMSEYRELVLVSECDQCGTPVEFRATPAAREHNLRDVRDDWNLHHRVCSTARGVKAGPFEIPVHPDSYEPLAIITEL